MNKRNNIKKKNNGKNNDYIINGNHVMRKQKVSKLPFEKLEFPSLDSLMEKINKKVGKKLPKMPKSLPKGKWTKQAIKVLKERYLLKDNSGKVIETPDEMIWRVAWNVAIAEAVWGKNKKQIKKTAEDFYKFMIDKKFLPNSPTLMNAGAGNDFQYSACFVLPVEDSLPGIFDAIKYQALIHKTGGGTGFSFSRLRPRGSIVKTSKGVASGPVSFMKVFDAATNEIKQGGKRRGANMGILRVDHPDVQEFIHCKEDGGITNFNISVGITNKFIKAFEKGGDYSLIDPKTKKPVGKLSARKVFQEIAESAWRTGDPGLIFLDKINKRKSNPVPSLGPIEATNPCVTGDTLVSTKNGLEKIEDLYTKNIHHKKDIYKYKEKQVKVLVDGRLSKGELFKPTTRILKTGIKPVYRMMTKEGYEIKLTVDHKILTPKGWVEAQDLKKGQKILIVNRKGGFGKKGSLEEGQILGWLVGDGTMKAARAVLSFFGEEKEKLTPHFAHMVDVLMEGRQRINRSYPVGVVDIKGRGETRVSSMRLWRYVSEKGIIPGDKLKVPEDVLKGNKGMQKGFLQALFTADGHVTGSINKGVSARLTSISLDLLKDVQRLLLNFGIASKIYTKRRDRGEKLMLDGKGGKKNYICKAYHDLIISKENLISFAKEIAFLIDYKNAKLIDFLKEFNRGPYKERFEATFEKLIFEGKQTVYDLTEPSTSSFIANGIVVHNCGEQPLYPYDACNLGSIFLSYFVKGDNGVKDNWEEPDKGKLIDWKKLEETVKLAVRFLDDVVEVNPFPLPEIRKTVLAVRRIGLGIGGWADMLIDLGIPYDSQEAVDLAEKVMSFIQEKAVLASEKLAKQRSPFPLFHESIYKDSTPRRNSTVTTIAPTGTISIIAGTSSGIEPLFAICYQHVVKDESLDRTLTFVNPRFEKIAKKRGFWNEKLEKELGILGIVKPFKGIPEDVKKVFGTAHEIHYGWHIKMQAAFQKYTENAVSKTINLRKDAKVGDIKEAYLEAWKTGCSGITVFRDGCKDKQVLNAGTEKEKKEKDGGKDKRLSLPVIGRPYKAQGATYKLNTPVGTAFVTINQGEDGEPLELFVNVGKAGSDVTAMAEALGRTISISLRFKGDLTPKERVKEIALQLAGIGGRRSVGFGPKKVLSLPDAIAMALSNHFKFKVNGFLQPEDNHINEHENKLDNNKNGLNNNGNGIIHEVEIQKNHNLPAQAVLGSSNASVNNKGTKTVELKSPSRELSIPINGRDICPVCGANALVYEEGCSKCHVCGYSEC